MFLLAGLIMGSLAKENYAIAPKLSPYSEEALHIQSDQFLIANRNQLNNTQNRFYGVLSDITADSGLTGFSSKNGENIDWTDVLQKLINCESGFNENICIIDSNGLLSCGWFQFQKRTFYTYCEGNWKDPKDQTKCAIYLIRIGSGQKHWYNCWRSQNLPIV